MREYATEEVSYSQTPYEYKLRGGVVVVVCLSSPSACNERKPIVRLLHVWYYSDIVAAPVCCLR